MSLERDAVVPPSADAAASTSSRYLSRIDTLAAAADELRTLLAVLLAGCGQVRSELEGGLALLDVVQSVGDEDGRAFRRDLYAATKRLEQAMQATRGESFRILIHDGESTITEVARTAGISVQMVKRLVRSVEDA